jgi:hypothetical protein
MELQYKIILTWLTFASIAGILEAFYFNKNHEKKKFKGYSVKTIITGFRTLISIPLCLIVWLKVGFLESLLMGFIFLFSFPFLHDGFYYTTREILKKGNYPKYFIDQSDLTDSRFSFNFTVRTIFLIIALLIFPY